MLLLASHTGTDQLPNERQKISTSPCLADEISWS